MVFRGCIFHSYGFAALLVKVKEQAATKATSQYDLFEIVNATVPHEIPLDLLNNDACPFVNSAKFFEVNSGLLSTTIEFSCGALASTKRLWLNSTIYSEK